MRRLAVLYALAAMAILGIYFIEDDSFAVHGSSLSPPCSVRIQGSILPVTYDGQPRNNPDGTFYQGDSFYYLIWFSASPTCVGMRVSPLYSTGGLDVLQGRQSAGSYVDPGSITGFAEQASGKCDRRAAYSGCVYGRAVINSHATDPGCLLGDPGNTIEQVATQASTCTVSKQEIRQTVTALKKVCHISMGQIHCTIVPIVRTITLVPDVADARINLVLSLETLIDTDGYEARNLDGTYYSWDPITVRHVPYMEWKDQRANTIHFEIQRYSDIRMENTWDCQAESCSLSLAHPGFLDSGWQVGNGEGLAIFNATSLSDLGDQYFTYHVTAHNAGLDIADAITTTHVLVPSYEPKYSEYPYSLLSDDERTSYENQAVVALHYFGSYGGGPDDMPQIHEDRRSKINGFSYAGFGLDPWEPALFHDTLSWSEAQNVPLEDFHRMVQESRNPGAVQTGNIGAIPCHTNPDTAMLVRAGYCKIYFKYPILGTMIGPEGPKYENATLFNTLLSEGFAGRHATFLSHYEYRFSEAYFHTNLRVASIDGNGTINPIPLTASVFSNDFDAQSLDKYIHEKTLHDTADPGFANITSGDLYPLEYSESGEGEIDVKLRRVTAKFETYQNENNQALQGLEIENLAPLYFENSRAARIEVPLDVGLGSLAPVSVNVTAAGIAQQYDYGYTGFAASEEILINVAKDNALAITRYPGSIVISSDPGFGQIASLYVDGELHDVSCNKTCAISIDSDYAVYIRAENSWGGVASATAPELIREDSPGIRAFDPIPLALFILAMLPIYLVYSRLTQKSGK